MLLLLLLVLLLLLLLLLQLLLVLLLVLLLLLLSLLSLWLLRLSLYIRAPLPFRAIFAFSPTFLALPASLDWVARSVFVWPSRLPWQALQPQRPPGVLRSQTRCARSFRW